MRASSDDPASTGPIATQPPTTASDPLAGGPIAAFREGRVPRRLVQLYLGLGLYGASMALMIRSDLGLDPWDVFHQGLMNRIPLSFGTIVIVVAWSCCWPGSRSASGRASAP